MWLDLFIYNSKKYLFSISARNRKFYEPEFVKFVTIYRYIYDIYGRNYGDVWAQALIQHPPTPSTKTLKVM